MGTGRVVSPRNSEASIAVAQRGRGRPGSPCGETVVPSPGPQRRERRMRAMQITDLGQPLRLAEVPVPEPGPGEVLLRVAACGINFADTLMVAGRYQEKPALPFAPGARGLRHRGGRRPRRRGARAGHPRRGLRRPAASPSMSPWRRPRAARGAGQRCPTRSPRLPDRLRHQPRRARLARPPPAGRDPARHRRRRAASA